MTHRMDRRAESGRAPADYPQTAAAMFLSPVARVAGGYLLLAVFIFAAAFHILHGEFNEVGWLAVYSAAVMVCLTN